MHTKIISTGDFLPSTFHDVQINKLHIWLSWTVLRRRRGRTGKESRDGKHEILRMMEVVRLAKFTKLRDTIQGAELRVKVAWSKYLESKSIPLHQQTVYTWPVKLYMIKHLPTLVVTVNKTTERLSNDCFSEILNHHEVHCWDCK